ncbi:MAG: DUF362 domain-containing protein [Clostridiales bacterium]|nr:DUF362 domain-containing protein [Clostridiales bacterium]
MQNAHLSELVSFVYDPSVTCYILQPPFDPHESYPELPFVVKGNEQNGVYSMVRSLLTNLRMDAENIGTKFWNPFRELVKPGDNVVIKPNLISHTHYLGKSALYSSIVHGCVVRPIVDYLHLAMQGQGTILIADNPIVGTDFNALMEFTGIQDMVDILNARGYTKLAAIDLRPRILKESKSGEFYYQSQRGDPLGYVDINLGKESLFSEFDDRPETKYYTLADPSIDHVDPKFKGKSETDRYHNSQAHVYTISKSVLNSDLLINIAKMKTHCKAGVTLLLKNAIGVVYGKGCLPHWRQGIPPDGDSSSCYPPAWYIYMQQLYVKFRKTMRIHRFPGFRKFRNYLQRKNFIVGQYKHLEHGNWKGNDTIWRTILDLNRILLYADKTGIMRDRPQRGYFGLIDGIISQQGEGPMAGNPRVTSIIFGGFNPLIVDACAVKSMGISPQLINCISKARRINKWKLFPDEDFDISLPEIDVPVFNFKLPKGWQ